MVEKVKLNATQKRAVTHDGGPALVVAGAGTGKTAVISMRIAHLIQNKGVAAQSILALTFTEKAAAEMQDRVDRLLPLGYVDTSIFTFHALGDKILREFSFELGLPSDFVVMSQFQQVIAMQQVLESTKLIYHKTLANPYGLTRALLQFVSRLKDENITEADFAQFVTTRKDTEDKTEFDRLQELATVYSAYQKHCLAQGMIDYGDQIMLVIGLLERFPKIAQITRETYRYILVDEYQDTNFAQNYLLKLLSKQHRNLMVVGDDDQSIYGFRGAAIENILGFMRDFADAKQIVLTQNYRSTQKILDTAYGLIGNNNPYRLESENAIDKRLKGSNSPSTISVEAATTHSHETEALADWIEKLHVSKKIAYSDMAILLRKNNQAASIATALQKKNIPFMVAESQNLFEQPEIKVLLHFVQVLNDPSASASLYGLLASDLWSLPLEKIAQISAEPAKQHLSLEEYLRSHMTDSTEQVFAQVLGVIDAFRSKVQSGSAGQLLYQFLETSGYFKRLVDESEADSLAVAKLQNIAQFFGLVKEFEMVSLDTHIYALWRYLQQITASEADIMVQASPLDMNAVSIMTVHKAKGLEFAAVALIDLVEQTFPARKMSDKIRIPDGLLEPAGTNIDWHIHEERRLFYVAMTRAKRHLWLSCAFDHGKKRLKKPSRFIAEATGAVLNVPQDSAGSSIKSIQQFQTLPEMTYEPLGKFLDQDGWLHLTTNQIADYVRSPKEFWYFSVLNLPKGPFHALVYGSAMHAALEIYYKSRVAGNMPALNELLEVFERSWKSEGFVSLQHEKERFVQGKKTLKVFYARNKSLLDLPNYIEKPFTLRQDALKLTITGRYDAVFEREGQIEVRDFKTSDVSSQKSADTKLRDSVQMGIYALAWEQTHSQPVESISLYFIENDILAQSTKINNAKTLALLAQVSEGIRNKRFDEKGSSQIEFEKLL